DPLDELAEARELALPVGGQADEVAPAVVRIAAALDEAALLERVEEAHELAAVEAQGVRNRRLRLAGALAEEREDAVVVGAEARLLERLHCPHLRADPEPAEEEHRARHELARHARLWNVSWGCRLMHLGIIVAQKRLSPVSWITSTISGGLKWLRTLWQPRQTFRHRVAAGSPSECSWRRSSWSS